jgi:hypothetical protein
VPAKVAIPWAALPPQRRLQGGPTDVQQLSLFVGTRGRVLDVGVLSAVVIPGSVTGVSFGTFIVVVAIDAGLATLVFRHAYRRKNRHATAWGVFTFLAAGVAIPVYFLNYWLGGGRRPR